MSPRTFTELPHRSRPISRRTSDIAVADLPKYRQCEHWVSGTCDGTTFAGGSDMTRLVLLVSMMVACIPQPAQPRYVAGAPGSEEEKPSTEDPNSGTVECHDEAITGSIISHTV